MKIDVTSRSRSHLAELKRLEASLQAPALGKKLGDSFRLVVQFELFAGLVYKARRQGYAQQAELEDELSQVYQTLLIHQTNASVESIYKRWITAYRLAWRQNFSLFVVTALLFAGSLLVGWFCALQRPSYATLIFSQVMQEQIVSHTPWFKGLNDNPLIGGLQIAVNNITVSLKMFSAGCLLGIGGLLLLIYNGIQIGGLFGYCFVYGFDQQLLTFTLSHGPLELSIIVAAAFCGLLVGKSFFISNGESFSNKAERAVRVAFTVLIGILPWLVLAALFEAFVSPSDHITVSLKIAWGSALALVFWAWTFWPSLHLK